MTLDRVELDLDGAFAPGQAYVAMSRVKNLEGLSIKCLPRTAISVNRKVSDFYEGLKQYML